MIYANAIGVPAMAILFLLSAGEPVRSEGYDLTEFVRISGTWPVCKGNCAEYPKTVDIGSCDALIEFCGKPCWTGSKPLCAYREAPNLPYVSGTAPFCKGECDGSAIQITTCDRLWHGDHQLCGKCVSGEKRVCLQVCNVSCQVSFLREHLGVIPEEHLSTVPNDKLLKMLKYGGKKVSRRQVEKTWGFAGVIEIDIGGEGRHLYEGCYFGYDDTININIWNKVTAGPDKGKIFANFFAGNAADLPFEKGFADRIYIENAFVGTSHPLSEAVMGEIARVIRKPGGLVTAVGTNDGDTKKWVHALAEKAGGFIKAQNVICGGYLQSLVEIK